MIKVPTQGSEVKVRMSYPQGSAMIPPKPTSIEFTGKVLQPYKWLSDRQFCMSGDSNWPIRVISVDSLEDIELLSGSMKEVDTDLKVYEVEGSKGNKYIVTKSNKGWTCTCTGFQFRNQCKHIAGFRTKDE